METQISIAPGTAQELTGIAPQSVDLIVTSPPYPMIEMWDRSFATQDPRIGRLLETGRGREAFERMHCLLDAAWQACDRVLKPGGLVCLNIGDATRRIDGDFQLYANHARLLSNFLARGYAALPDIVWRKPTNAPNKFMGSGMLPVGAYVTYEHEYILVLRKGPRRRFTTSEDQRRRRESAFFWEERNLWFSDVWHDIRGASQALANAAARERSAAFPFELAYRLICMFSVKLDRVLDPFAGTGTTLAAALAAGRHALGVERDPALAAIAHQALAVAPDFANAHLRQRLARHVAFAAQRAAAGKPLKYTNAPHGFPVMTAQERDLQLDEIIGVTSDDPYTLRVAYAEPPQTDFR